MAGEQAEAHTTEASVGHLLARAFLASCGLFVPVPPFGLGFCEKLLWARALCRVPGRATE